MIELIAPLPINLRLYHLQIYNILNQFIIHGKIMRIIKNIIDA